MEPNTKPTYKTLWTITSITALALLAATVYVVGIGRSDEVLVGKVVTLTGPSNLVFLRESAGRSAEIVTTVQRGSSARVAAYTITDSNETWFLVETADGPGWVPQNLIERAGSSAAQP